MQPGRGCVSMQLKVRIGNIIVGKETFSIIQERHLMRSENGIWLIWRDGDRSPSLNMSIDELLLEK